MTKTPSIASVTVAYNGAAVLAKHLDALQRQSRRLDEIIVVNNASTDDTVTLLRNEYPEITVLDQPENGGVGGGFAAGLAYAALKKNYDWVWLFDQDSVPARDGLERLLAGVQHLDGTADRTAILAPECMHPETKASYPGLSWCGGCFLPTQVAPDKPITFVDMVISSGSLIRRQAIEAAGLPRADFFMDFVDYEHCLRLRRKGFCIAVVRGSVLDHAIGNPSQIRILGLTKSWTDHAPWREYYMTRNEIFTIWRYCSESAIRRFVLRRLARHALDVVLYGKQKSACLRMMYRGLLDGRAGRLGIRVLPVEERQTASTCENSRQT